jgi:hypothetical protein
MDQFNHPQFHCVVFCAGIVRFLLFQHEIYCDARFGEYDNPTCGGHLSWIYHLPACISFGRCSIDKFVDVGGYIRIASSYFHSATEVGNGWIFAYLRSIDSGVFICPATSCVLEYG